MNGYCKVSVYRNCSILPNKNFKVDSISDYLSTLDLMTGQIIQGQLMKHQLKLSYKLMVSNSDLELDFRELSNFNYLMAQNFTYSLATGEKATEKVYYFIRGKKWISQECIEFDLEMDVINTLIDNNLSSGEKLDLSEKTYILREHKNRWQRVSGTLFNFEPIIDYMSEGFNPLLFKKREVPYYYQKDGEFADDRSWYLIYRSQSTDENAPIQIMCCSDYAIETAQGIIGYSGTKDVKKVLGNNSWIIYGADGQGGQTNVGASISFTDKDGSHTLTISSANECIAIGDKYIFFGTISSSGFYIRAVYKSGAFKRFRNVDFRRIYACRKSTDSLVNQSVGDTLSYMTASYILNWPLDSSFDTTYQNFTICAIDDIDRTDPKLLKIIKLPYPPFEFKIIEHELIIPSGWEVRQAEENPQHEIIFPEILLYSDSSLVNPFTNEFYPVSLEASDNNPFSIFSEKTISYFGRPRALKDISLETKLYHSDYYKQKLVYDSFYIDIKAEALNFNSVKNSACKLEFSITATMNSKMMFRVKDLISYTSYKEEVGDIQDYSGVLYVARNNELPVFNSAYLNYIRTGYNYDIKTKNRQLTSSIIGGVLSTAGAIASAMAGGTGIGIVGAIGLGVGAVSQFSKAVISTAQAEQNIAQKLKSTEMEGLSIAGSDDVDLMSIYTDNNKLKYVRYEISERMKLSLGEFFYYCGYVSDVYGNPLERVNSRMWFNFVQCEAVYKYTQNFPQELLDKLTEKFKEGITFLHKNSVVIDNTPTNLWDFEQQYENWENI